MWPTVTWGPARAGFGEGWGDSGNVQWTPAGNPLRSPPAGFPNASCPPPRRHSVEFQVLVHGDVVLELVGLKEVAQLPEVALVQPVHLLL